MTLKDLLASVSEPCEVQGGLEENITGVVYDSRQVRPGCVFVAMQGEVTDGNKFVPQAVAKGAVAVVSERDRSDGVSWVKVKNARKVLAELSRVFYKDPSRRMSLVGITGTNGKTTTSYLMESILREAGEKACVIGTINSRIGDKMYNAERTTPESPDLLAFLDRAVESGCRFGVMEVSSHSLDRLRVYGCKFRAAVFTNLTRDHLDYHGDFESYFQAKRKLFVNEERNHPDVAIINIDDSWGQRLMGDISSEIITYGLSDAAHVRPKNYAYDLRGIQLEAQVFDRALKIKSPLPGRANLYNVLGAVAAGHALKLSYDAIEKGIARLRSVPGRFELVECGQPFVVLVDYAHTDDALRNLLDLVKDCAKGRIITLFGCGGDRDRTKRPLMGEVAGLYSDLVVATSDNPRSEDPDAILKEIEAGLKKTNANYMLMPDRRDAIEHAIKSAQPDDVVILAGKGHETTQVFKDKVIPFDDREVAREILESEGRRAEEEKRKSG